MGEFNDSEKAQLAELLSNPILMRAFSASMVSVHAEGTNAFTIESAAMAHRYERGATTFFNNLFQLAAVRAPVIPTIKKLREVKE